MLLLRLSCRLSRPLVTALCGTVMVLVSLSSTVHADLLNPSDKKQYEIAFRALDAGRWDVALNHAGRASETLPAKAIEWLYLQSSDSKADFREITKFIADNPSWPRLDRLKSLAERAMTNTLPDPVIIAWFRENPPTTGGGFFLYINALERAGTPAMVQSEVKRAWRDLDMSGSDEHEFRQRFRKLVPMEDEIYRLDRQIWERNFGGAERQMRRVPDGYRQLADARIRLARMSGGVDAAVGRVPPNLSNDPGLTFERLRWRRRKGRDADAIELLAWPDMQTSHPEMWWTERAILSRDLLEAGNPELAYTIASQHRVPDGADFAEAEWFSGWVALRFLNDPEKAFPHFRDMYNNVGYPVSRSRAAYWAGRAAEAAGKAEISQQWYGVAAQHPTSFYGQVAAMKLPPALQTVIATDPHVTPDHRRVYEEAELTRLVRMLGELGADDTVRTLIAHLSSQYNDPAYLTLTSELAADIDRLDLAVFASRQAIKTEVVTLAGYPLLPFKASQLSDLTIVHGLIRQESGFDIDAVSSAGALGLMQLMPGTAKVVSGWEKLRYDKAALTTDIDYNVRLGSAYLKDLLQKFDGVLPMAFAGYNAGPSRVVEWSRRFGDPRSMDFEETIDWMESIPFPETRNYVQRVLENINVYRQRAAGRPVPISMTAETG